MDDSIDKPAPYHRAIWRHVASDAVAGLRAWWRMLIQGGIGLIGTIVAVSFLKPDTFAEKVGIAALGLVIVLVFTAGIHLLWSWATAPRRLYDQQQAAIQAAESNCGELREKLENAQSQLLERPASQPSPIGHLEIVYDKVNHSTRHPDGYVEVKFLLRNKGPGRAHVVRPKLESATPQRKVRTSSPFSSQFPAIRLQVERESPGFSMHPRDIATVKLIRAERGATEFLIDGYDIHNNPGTFTIPAGQYEQKVVVTGRDGGSDERTFIATKKRNGELDVEMV